MNGRSGISMCVSGILTAFRSKLKIWCVDCVNSRRVRRRGTIEIGEMDALRTK